MAYEPRADNLCRVRISGIRYNQNHLPGHAQAACVVVSRDLAGDQPEDRCQCPGGPTGSGVGQLQDSVDMVAQIASGDGSAGTRQTEWACGGGRLLLGCFGGRDSWSACGFQDGDCRCGGGRR